MGLAVDGIQLCDNQQHTRGVWICLYHAGRRAVLGAIPRGSIVRDGRNERIHGFAVGLLDTY